MSNNIIDIIIPLYNGYSFFKNCLESVIKNTPPEKYRLIIVDDKSTEKKLIDYLEKIQAEYPDIIILRNEKNLGFVGSANRGMRYGKENDVLLLNSDTVVTKNWLTKIRECAYSRENIGTVTPITNNGAMVSFPNQWQDNEIHKNFTLDSLAELIENSSPGFYPEIPSPVGFCMYIKREVIKRVGLFDRIYGKGYGEENDFGMRAYRLGYRHVLDDKTFILHKGSLSFQHIGTEKRKLIEKNTKILYDRFPELNNLLIQFEEKNPLKTIYDNLELNLATNRLSKRGILFVSVAEPSDFDSGALFHTKNLIDNISDDFSKYLIYRKKNKLILTLYVNSEKKINYTFSFLENFSVKKFNHPEIEFIWEIILKNFNIDIVHFQTPQELPLSLFSLSKKMGKSVFFTAHDFLLFCPSFILMRRNFQENSYSFCNYETSEEICKECLKNKMAIYDLPENFQKIRRLYIRENVLPFIDKFFFPSKFLKEATQTLFNKHIPEEKTFVISHGIRNNNNKYVPPLQSENLNIAFLGSFIEEKGSRIFVKIMNELGNDPYFKFFIIGTIGDTKALSLINKVKNLIKIGHYDNKKLPEIVRDNKLHLSLILSLCPETFSLTISESWANSLPVITLDHGAQKERVLETNAGWIVSLKNPEKEIVKILKNLKRNKYLLQEKINNIPQIKSEKENAKEFDSFYRKAPLTSKDKLDSRRMMSFLERKKTWEFPEIDQSKTDQKAKVFSLDRSRFKHYIFVICDKLGIVDIVKPFYYRHKERIENFINCLIC